MKKWQHFTWTDQLVLGNLERFILLGSKVSEMWKLHRSPGINARLGDWQWDEQESNISFETQPNTCFIILSSLFEANDLIENIQLWKQVVGFVYIFTKNLNA